jgi:hypothetical protein
MVLTCSGENTAFRMNGRCSADAPHRQSAAGGGGTS